VVHVWVIYANFGTFFYGAKVIPTGGTRQILRMISNKLNQKHFLLCFTFTPSIPMTKSEMNMADLFEYTGMNKYIISAFDR
jgi:hypothetical protein